MLFCDEIASRRDFIPNKEILAVEKIAVLICASGAALGIIRASCFFCHSPAFPQSIVAIAQRRATFKTSSRMLHRVVTVL
jgi:hypothetical protein